MKKLLLAIAISLLPFSGIMAMHDETFTIDSITAPEEFIKAGGVVRITTGHYSQCFAASPDADPKYKPCASFTATSIKIPAGPKGYGRSVDVSTYGTVVKVRRIFSKYRPNQHFHIVLDNYIAGPDNKEGTIEIKIIPIGV